MNNPYRGFGCPVSGSDFVGRGEIVGQISSTLKTGNVSLTGLHRMGKSSVAQEVLERLSAEGVPVCKVVNLHTVKTDYDLFRLMLIALGSPAYRTLPKDDDFMAFVETEEAFEGKRHERSSRCVMVIDEMDGILSFDDPVQTLNRLRELASYPAKYGVSFLFVTSRSLRAIEDRMNGSNLSGICENIFLGPFDREEMAEFVAWGGISADEAFVDELCAQTGGVPYLMAVLMSEFCEQAGDRRAGMSGEEKLSVLRNCIPSVAQPFLEYYRKVKRSLSDEGNAWGELIGALIGPIMKARDPALSNLFREYGIIADDGTCPSRHFMDYLEMCSRDVAPFEDLRDLEIGLRKIVRERLTEKLGPQWAEAVSREVPAIAQGLDRARQSMEKEIRQFRLATESDLIEFTDLGDIKTIVTSKRYWPWFQAPIGLGVDEFTKRMDMIIPMRNRTMHFRPGQLIPPEHIAQARESCKILLARIK